MGLIEKLFKPMTVKTPEGEVYLRRYFLLRTRWLEIYVHHIFRSDPDADMHDHPWPFVSMILKGGYVEHMPEGSFQRHAGQVLYRPVGSPHRLELKRPAWTLVAVGRTQRTWGFHTDHGWERWDDHAGKKAARPGPAAPAAAGA